MIRVYDRFKVIGTERLDHGSNISWTETGICLEDQDPIQIAISRNNNMLRCYKYKVEREHAFSVMVGVERNERNAKAYSGRRSGDTPGYRNMIEKWRDPEYFW